MRACVNAAVMPLSLKLPDGFIPSYWRNSRPGVHARRTAPTASARWQERLPFADGHDLLGRGEREQLAEPPDAARSRAGRCGRPTWPRSRASDFGTAEPVPVVGDVEQAAARAGSWNERVVQRPRSPRRRGGCSAGRRRRSCGHCRGTTAGRPVGVCRPSCLRRSFRSRASAGGAGWRHGARRTGGVTAARPETGRLPAPGIPRAPMQERRPPGGARRRRRSTRGAVLTMSRRLVGRTRLTVELLEARETPTAGPWAVESFDAVPPGGGAPGWTAWASDGDRGFRAAAGGATGNGVISAGDSAGRTGPGWRRDCLPTRPSPRQSASIPWSRAGVRPRARVPRRAAADLLRREHRPRPGGPDLPGRGWHCDGTRPPQGRRRSERSVAGPVAHRPGESPPRPRPASGHRGVAERSGPVAGRPGRGPQRHRPSDRGPRPGRPGPPLRGSPGP